LILPSPPDALKIGYSFIPKAIAWAEPGGTKWNGNSSVFTFSSGWQNYIVPGAYKSDIRVSNNINNTATTYFDGEQIEIGYALGPSMGFLEVIVDGAIVATLGQGAAVYTTGLFWNSGPAAFSDNVHKLVLRHGVGGTKANFDYLTVYPALDLIPPGQIVDLIATTGATTGKVTLKWTSTGDDMNVGTAHHYEVRYFLFPIPTDCPTDWATGSPITMNLPKPAISGTLQQVTLSGLAPGIHYDFCIAAWDEAGNMGTPSNVDDAIALAGVPYGTGTYDDRNIGWVYTGNWKLVNNNNARNNTLHISSGLNDSALFYFTGNQFVFSYITGPLGGLVDVYIDELYYTTIDQFTPFGSIRYFTSPILPLAGGPYVPPLPGPHTVRFIHMTGVQMTVDQIYINTTYDLGAPDPITDLFAPPVFVDGTVDLTWTAVGDDPSLIGFPPGDNTAVKYEVRYSPALGANCPIVTETNWDYASPAAGVFSAPQAFGNLEAMTVVGLTPGVDYCFAVRVSDDAYYSSLSNSIIGSSPYSGLYVPAGPYEDTDPQWIYTGLWNTIFSGSATGGTQHNTGLAGSSAVFHFNGTGFMLTFQKGASFGKVDVYVDGVLVYRLDQYSLYTQWQRTWTSPVFAPGNHVVEFRLVGTKASIDMLQILP
jgi:hypothetical protein